MRLVQDPAPRMVARLDSADMDQARRELNEQYGCGVTIWPDWMVASWAALRKGCDHAEWRQPNSIHVTNLVNAELAADFVCICHEALRDAAGNS